MKKLPEPMTVGNPQFMAFIRGIQARLNGIVKGDSTAGNTAMPLRCPLCEKRITNEKRNKITVACGCGIKLRMKHFSEIGAHEWEVLAMPKQANLHELLGLLFQRYEEQQGENKEVKSITFASNKKLT